MGGPLARLLIRRHQLCTPGETPSLSPGGGHRQEQRTEPVTAFSFLATLFWLNVSLALGEVLHEALGALGRSLPLFVCGLLAAILITNTVPRLLPIPWPAHSPALALVSDVSLGVFLAMSLMSLQLWTLSGLGGTLLVLLVVQFAVAFLYAFALVFPAMGGDYEAAVVCAGFGGFSLGATPTAMANMASVTGRYGAADRAFLVVPLVSGFFIDITNSLVIQGFLRRIG
jgi:ESS family glutamate:Na+ symporter